MVDVIGNIFNIESFFMMLLNVKGAKLLLSICDFITSSLEYSPPIFSIFYHISLYISHLY